MITVEFVVAKGKTIVSQRTVAVDIDTASVLPIAPVGEAESREPQAADVVFTLTPALDDALRSGTLSLSTGFMRGSIKMAGDNAALFAVLPILHHNLTV